MTNTTPIFALTTHGLEAVSAAELAALPGLTAITTAYRRVLAICADARVLHAVLALRTVDDAFLHLADWHGMARERATLARLRALSAELDLKHWLPTLLGLRPIPRAPTFSVTASFVGARNYTMPEIRTAVSAGVARRYSHWHYSEDDETADLNLRVFIEHDAALVGLRLAARPLHRRAYKQAHQPGSLKPPVAAALLRLAGVASGTTVLDPFCGAGTILAEALAVGARSLGGDRNAEALQVARANLGSQGEVLGWDACALPLVAHSVDAAVSNPPWGRQITPDDDLRRLYARALAQMRRVTRPGGQIVLLTGVPELMPVPPDDSFAISLFGQRPVIARWRC